MKTIYYNWRWEFESPPEKFWPLVSDTNKFNRDTGLPKVQISPSNNPDDGYLTLFFVQYGIKVEWQEYSFDWVYPHKFSVLRKYLSGPVRQMLAEVNLFRTGSGGTRLEYKVVINPANILGYISIPIYIGYKSRIAFKRIFTGYDRILTNRVKAPERNYLSSAQTARLNAARIEFLNEYRDSEIIDKLCRLIANGDEFAVQKLRPYQLAKEWDTPRKKTLQHFLYATRTGLLDLKWDILCPLCRGTKNSFDSLHDLTGNVHCENCKIDVSVNFDKLIEISFRPSTVIREVGEADYCVGGPQVTPHIITQQQLRPNTSTKVQLQLEAGSYRLRTRNFQSGIILEVTTDSSEVSTCNIKLNNLGFSIDTSSLNHQSVITIENISDKTELFIFEKLSWFDDAVTASEISAMQTFRDLFASEVIKPGLQISVGNITLLFTDLKNSTTIYRTIGDVPAFSYVIDHFDILRKAIDENNGAIVKTIGDAVMAVFNAPVSAIKAVLQSKKEIKAAESGLKDFKLKAGIHFGPCIAVNLNERLDYFGSTVNITARLEGQSNGEDIVLSGAIYNDPDVQQFLKENNTELAVENYLTTLKGFDTEQFELRRVNIL